MSTEKIAALKVIVGEAVKERNAPPPYPPFEGSFNGETPSLDQLVNLLQTTDALDTLNDVLNEKDNR